MNNHAKSRRNKDERNRITSILLHQNPSDGRKGDCDRSSIRVFETQLASQPHGDWLSDTRVAQKAVSKFLIRIAKENDLYIEEQKLHLLGERKHLPSGESIIYENASQGVVYKVRNPFAKIHLKNKQAIDVLYDHIAHNLLFPDIPYKLIGITSILDDVHFILAQPFIYTCTTPTQHQIDSHLRNMGLFPEDNYYYGNDYISVTDVNEASDNVLINTEGKLLFIDPIIKLKKPIDEIIKAFPFREVPQKESLISRIKKKFTHKG